MECCYIRLLEKRISFQIWNSLPQIFFKIISSHQPDIHIGKDFWRNHSKKISCLFVWSWILWQPASICQHKGLDTTQPLLSLTLHVQDNFKSGKYTAAAFLDMEGAFWLSTVWKKRLIYGTVNQTGLLIIDDFLKKRLTRILVNSIVTNYMSIEVGVPQGSVCLVILLLVFSETYPKTYHHTSHDLTAWKTADSPDEADAMLTMDLSKVHAWSLKWQMGISAPKSKVMCFSHRGHHSITVVYNHQPLKQVLEIRSLWVILNEKLCFKVQTSGRPGEEDCSTNHCKAGSFLQRDRRRSSTDKSATLQVMCLISTWTGLPSLVWLQTRRQHSHNAVHYTQKSARNVGQVFRCQNGISITHTPTAVTGHKHDKARLHSQQNLQTASKQESQTIC